MRLDNPRSPGRTAGQNTGARARAEGGGAPGLYLVVLGVWMGILGPVRSALHHRRTGDIGLGAWVPRGSVQRCVGTVSLLNGCVLVAVPALHRAGVRPIAALSRPGHERLGVALAMTGMGVSVYGQSAMGDSWRGDVDPRAYTALVTTGPFRVVRNPIYTGTSVTTIGLGLLLPSPPAVVAVVVQAMMTVLQVRLVEEPYLRRRHGAAYVEYAARTGRFLPRLGTGLLRFRRRRPEVRLRSFVTCGKAHSRCDTMRTPVQSRVRAAQWCPETE